MFKRIKKWFNDPIDRNDSFGVNIRQLYQFFKNRRRDGKILEEEDKRAKEYAKEFVTERAHPVTPHPFDDSSFIVSLKMEVQTKILFLLANKHLFTNADVYIERYENLVGGLDQLLFISELPETEFQKIFNIEYNKNLDKLIKDCEAPIEDDKKETKSDSDVTVTVVGSELKDVVVTTVQIPLNIIKPESKVNVISTESEFKIPSVPVDPQSVKVPEIDIPVLPTNNFSVPQNVVNPDEEIVDNLIETRQDITTLPHEQIQEIVSQEDNNLTAREIGISNNQVEAEVVEEEKVGFVNAPYIPRVISSEVYDKVFEKIKKISEEQLDFQNLDIQKNSLFNEDLGFDSLDSVEMIMFCEEEFGITIDDDEINNIKTVDDAIKFLIEVKKVNV